MRWITGSLAALVLVLTAFFISPYVALYQLSRAVQTRDLAAIQERVDMRSLRISLSRQLANAYLEATGNAEGSGGILANVSTNLADPILAEIVTPEAILDLLGQNGQVRLGQASIPTLAIDHSSVRYLWELFLSSQSHGFRQVTFAVPIETRREEQFILQLRLRSLAWRLAGIVLPESVIHRLVKEIISREKVGS